MYLPESDYKELMERISRLETLEASVHKLDATLQAKHLGCDNDVELAQFAGVAADEYGLFPLETFLEIVHNYEFPEIWRPDAYERITLDEFTAFLQIGSKIVNDPDWLHSMLTLGAILMRKERKPFKEDLKYVIDIREMLLKREKELEGIRWW